VNGVAAGDAELPADLAKLGEMVIPKVE